MLADGPSKRASTAARMPRPKARRLLLIFGSLIAVFNFVMWTARDFATYGELTTRGLMMALFVLTATLLLYVVLRLGIMLTGQEP